MLAHRQAGGGAMNQASKGIDSSMGPAELVEAGIVARRYYLENKTKKEIAEELGISRFKVARILDLAVERGLVSITINKPSRIDLELSDRLKAAYRLRRAVVVVAADGSDMYLRQDLGQVAANLLREVVTADDVVGIAWGRTLDAMTASLSSLPPCTVVQITGVAGSPAENSTELVRRLAAVSGGPVHQFFVPLVVADAHTASSLRSQPDVVAASALFSSLSIAVLAVGSWAPPDSQLRNAVSENDRAELERLGVVAEICAVFLDEQGNVVSSAVAERCISISAEQLRRIPELIAVAGGRSKIRAIRAVLRGGYATTPITDSITAKELLDE
jgi:DNA-binding transcriptional regulator LsrR (DeoR family)